MFKDKVYEGMDEVTRMFEPFQFDLNDELALFPDKIEIAPSTILEDRYWGSSFGVNINSIITATASRLKLINIELRSTLLLRNNFFKFEVEDRENGDDVRLDATTGKMSHKIFMVKNKVAFDEQMLESMRKDTILGALKSSLNRSSLNKPRFNEIADIYSADEVKSERSYRGKLNKFCDHLEKMIDENVLDIRDMNLCIKFPEWIISYVRDGNLAALNNLTRIKIMTHEKRPIYSIEEKGVW